LAPHPPVSVSVNCHFTRKCNYECGFCFRIVKTSHVESWDVAEKGLTLLKDAGMRKTNFAGGEPLLYPKLLGPSVEFCKDELCVESALIVTNGSRVTERFPSIAMS
jgi:radical S-adenosyl methionine domain-containing protein 2